MPQFIEERYLRRFGKAAPDEVLSIEELALRMAQKKAKRKADQAARREMDEVPRQQTEPNDHPSIDTEKA